jgi:hypothetical protein
MTNYDPSWNQEFQKGLCTGFSYFGLGSGDCSQYLVQTLTTWDVICQVALNWTGQDWNLVEGGEPITFNQNRYIAITELVSIYLLIIIIPELFILKKRLNINLI